MWALHWRWPASPSSREGNRCDGHQDPSDARLAGVQAAQDYASATSLGPLEHTTVLARRLAVPISAIVLASSTSHSFVGIPVIGPLSQEQLRDSLADTDLTLTSEQLHHLIDGEDGAAACSLLSGRPLGDLLRGEATSAPWWRAASDHEARRQTHATPR